MVNRFILQAWHASVALHSNKRSANKLAASNNMVSRLTVYLGNNFNNHHDIRTTPV
jgi:hypothetical protein